MPSIIEGFTYEIFISYRQKDNKHDGWVTEFVNQLKGELEATFKEDISIYFDENPHDGLLETHNVDKSLEDKLKCLIFIPIISQTYCDPKSFAWEHEFCAFNKLAKEDRFGRDIRLTSGNVASRILPVKIHDIDPEDKALLENELGEMLRGIEFIYKEPGVNKPLTNNDDEKKNLNGTKYRIQINKVANAVKEIINAIKKQGQQPEGIYQIVSKPVCTAQKSKKTSIIITSIIALVLFILGILFIPKLFNPSEEVEKSIAVLPFRNLTSDSTQLYFCDGFMEEILNNLQKINSFTVRSRTSSDLYRDTKKPLTVIGNELDANYLIEGSVGREGDNLKIWVQLIDSKADKHIWSNDYTRESRQIFSLQSEIAKDIASELKTILSFEEKTQIEKSQTENLEAYDLYLQGRFFWNKRGEANLKLSKEYFEKALAKDPDYALAFSGLADVYLIQTVNGLYKPAAEGLAKAEELALKAIGLDENIAEPHTTLGSVLWNEMKWEEARKELLTAIKINPNYAEAYYNYAQLLEVLRQNKEARIQIDKAIKLSPLQMNYRGWSAKFYYNEGKFNEYFIECRKMNELNDNTTPDYFTYFRAYFWMGEYSKAFEAVQKLTESMADSLAPKYLQMYNNIYDSAGIDGLLKWAVESNPKNYYNNAKYYTMLGQKDLALECLEKYCNTTTSIQYFRLNNDYDLSTLHSEPRFQAIIKKMGLEKYQVPD